MEEPLSLEHQALLTSLWRPLCEAYDLKFAEYSFANAFLFRHKHSYRVATSNKTPIVSGLFSDGKAFIIPTEKPEDIQISSKHILFPIPEEWLPLLKGYQQSESRDDSDYLFQKTKFQTLQGRDLSSRRNLLHQLQVQHTLSSKPLEQEDIPEAIRFLEKWQNETGLAKEQTDYFSCLEGLHHLKQLGLFGRVIYADNVMIGFAIVELLTSRTALVHSAKTQHNEIKGATVFLYQDIAHHLPESVQWINLEQDLGLSSLRQAKNAYHPDLLLTKWRLEN